MSPLWERLRGFDLDLTVIDGHDPDAIRTALSNEQARLKIIVLQTIKGRGVSFMENRMDSHYLPFTETQFAAAIAEIDSP